MNEAKQTMKDIALSLRLDMTGVTSAVLPPFLKEILEKAGPLPFAEQNIEKRTSPSLLLDGVKSIFVILFPYLTSHPKEGNLSIYTRPKDYHLVNHKYMKEIISRMKEIYAGEDFYPICDTSPMVDRFLAYQAGLGFYGKNHLLINDKYGSYFTIGAILTTLDMEADTPLNKTCMGCERCYAACPGKALSDEGFKAYQCKSYLTQKKEDLTEEEKAIIKKTPLIFGCDHCQLVCPHNQRAALSPLPEMQEERIETLSKDLLLSTSNRNFEKNYKPYAFAWRGKKILLRNLEITEE